MRLWFAPSSEVPIYRQLVTQVTLAILSGDLRPGDKLPSTRELARRFAEPFRHAGADFTDDSRFHTSWTWGIGTMNLPPDCR